VSRAAREGTLLVLDFDGVICDSADEGFVSSWIAYYHLYRHENPTAIPIRQRAEYGRLRPFTRSGPDFPLVQEIIHTGVDVRDQAEFDAAASRAGVEKMRLFGELYYQARTDLLARDREFWLSINRLYPHVREAFGMIPPAAPVQILSTKKPQFIHEILAGAGIRFPASRVHHAPSHAKLPSVEALRAAGGFTRAVFIDDQIDFLRKNGNPKITAYLASWGYVDPAWLREDSGVPVMYPDALVTLVRELFLSG
jgi:phosphoglycolate phosphatase-like HAD superfamily hydrolase